MKSRVYTRSVSVWCEKRQRYVTESAQGYDYSGPWTLAMDRVPVWVAQDYRVGNDTGTPGSSWRAALNTAADAFPNEKVRLRVNVGETADATVSNTGSWVLQFSVNGGAFATVGAATAVAYAASGGTFTDGSTLTQAFAGVTGSAAYQSTWSEADTNNAVTSRTWTDDDTEYEYCLLMNSVTAGQTITFRMLAPGGVATTFVNVPTLNIIAIPSNFEQDKYRFRNDDGSETAATWIAAADTAADIDVYSGNKQARLRFVVKQTNAASESITPQLEAGIEGEAATWTQQTNSFGATELMWGIAHGNGVWVACGSRGANVYTATDPTGTWTERTSNLGAQNAYGLAYGNSIWVVAGTLGTLSTATDPTGTWTARTSNFGTSDIRCVAYGNGVWVAVGVDGKLATATDPTGTWTLRASSFDTSTIWWVVYDNSVWVAVGASGKLATATDPTGTWTQQTSSFGTSDIWGIAYGNGVWVAVGSDGKLATATTPTGTWTQRTSSFDTTLIYNVAYGDGWVAVGASGKLATATDPTGTWTQQTSSFGTTNITNVTYATELWVAVGWAGKHATGVNIAWANVTTTSTPVKAFDSTNLTNGGDTTQQIGAGSFVTDNNGISEDGTGGPTTFAGSDEAEYEFTVEFISADLADGDTVYLRIANVDSYSA